MTKRKPAPPRGPVADHVEVYPCPDPSGDLTTLGHEWPWRAYDQVSVVLAWSGETFPDAETARDHAAQQYPDVQVGLVDA